MWDYALGWAAFGITVALTFLVGVFALSTVLVLAQAILGPESDGPKAWYVIAPGLPIGAALTFGAWFGTKWVIYTGFARMLGWWRSSGRQPSVYVIDEGEDDDDYWDQQKRLPLVERDSIWWVGVAFPNLLLAAVVLGFATLIVLGVIDAVR